MTTQSQRCCGTCQFYEPRWHLSAAASGRCMAPIPLCTGYIGPINVTPAAHQNCPSYRRKKTEQKQVV